jgi:2-C-methyl-D-erythritol 4-phosphate cytidylyltransferase
MTAAAVIVAAGRGSRAGGDVPKQWQMLRGQPVVNHTLAVFKTHPAINQIVLVLHPDELTRDAGFGTFTVVPGGTDRAASVRNGLAATDAVDYVLIHDVARPLVTHDTITAVLHALAHAAGAAPALAVTDALWTGAEGKVTGTRDRRALYRAQTPQGFDRALIIAAHAAHPGGAPDDVAVARAYGLDVAIVPGDEDNLKITHAQDFARAERILRGRDGH